MFKPNTFSEICNAMQLRAEVQINNIVGLVTGVQLEDGSGRCWIVTMYGKNVNLPTKEQKVETFKPFVRC